MRANWHKIVWPQSRALRFQTPFAPVLSQSRRSRRCPAPSGCGRCLRTRGSSGSSRGSRASGRSRSQDTHAVPLACHAEIFFLLQSGNGLPPAGHHYAHASTRSPRHQTHRGLDDIVALALDFQVPHGSARAALRALRPSCKSFGLPCRTFWSWRRKSRPPHGQTAIPSTTPSLTKVIRPIFSRGIQNTITIFCLSTVGCTMPSPSSAMHSRFKFLTDLAHLIVVEVTEGS